MSTKNKITTNETPERYLIEGANMLMEEFTFFIRILIDQLLHTWLEGGQDITASIAKGLEEITDVYGYDDYTTSLSTLLKGFAVNMIAGPYTNGGVKRYMIYFSAMFEIGSCINDYEILHKRNKKLPEAA